MASLSQLLERLRRVPLPPGAAAGAVAVPSAGVELSGEVEFLFGDLDAIEQRSAKTVSAARSEAAEIEAAAGVERRRSLSDAHAQAERLAAQLLAERRASCEERVRAMVAEAQREAERVLARGRERTPELVDEVIRRMLGSAG